MKTVRNKVWLLAVALLAAWTTAGTAEEKKPEWTVDDILLAESASQFQVSPDGKWAVWVRSAVDKEKGESVSNLWLSSLTEKKELQLTRGTVTHSAPRWSPDGSVISFLSTRPLPDSVKKSDLARAQLWLMNPSGGEPWHLTEFERGIRAYAWRDKETIVFAAQEDPALYEKQLKEKKDTSQVVDDEPHEPPVRLFQLNVNDKKVKRLTENNDWIELLEISPDGRWAVTRHARSLSYQFDQRVPPVTFLTNLETGEQKQIFTEGRVYPFVVRWARDSKGFYAAYSYSRHPKYLTATIELLTYYDVGSGKETPVELDWERGLGSVNLQVTENGLLVLLADGVRYKPALYRLVPHPRPTGMRYSWDRAWVEGEHERNIFGWALGEDGRTLVYNHSTASRPTQWYRARLEGARIADSTQLTELNEFFKDKPLYKTEVVRWKGARDEEVEGILYYPMNYEEGKKYALVLDIHGGPTAADLDQWGANWGAPKLLLSQKGAFVLEVNYHGSSNYGLDWVESICCGKYYDLEIPDIEAGVDSLIARGLVDPEKLATMGWSNGSILSIELITRNPRYRAASVGAGDVEWISDWANVDFGAAFDNYYFGAAPYEDPELYLRKSPVFRMKDVKTPTLIFFGTEDRNVPTSQGWTHYRVMQQLGQTEVRFVLFPGEAHGLRKLAHQKRKMEEEQVWFDRHLFGTWKAPNEAFKEGSPLDVAFKRGKIHKVGTQYGVLSKGKLVPEVVKHKGLELGRFEVTRAQYAAFDRAYKVEPGTDNFPAAGIRFEQAQAYAAWLAKHTGETYRVANEDEVKDLYDGARGNENTLDYWAGYALNPDDAARLAKKVAELVGAAPLLREVGQFQGRGEDELVFDLGGNVAEWCIGADGKAKLVGGSADRAADPKARATDAGEAYRGFRVVRGALKKKEEKEEKEE